MYSLPSQSKQNAGWFLSMVSPGQSIVELAMKSIPKLTCFTQATNKIHASPFLVGLRPTTAELTINSLPFQSKQPKYMQVDSLHGQSQTHYHQADNELLPKLTRLTRAKTKYMLMDSPFLVGLTLINWVCACVKMSVEDDSFLRQGWGCVNLMIFI